MVFFFFFFFVFFLFFFFLWYLSAGEPWRPEVGLVPGGWVGGDGMARRRTEVP
ncbi:hypothetical protein [Actinoplanes nipponensis]|uniref:hypothetical protein n=1 Tax=Actinoplanes nipponensis TaxID=135950 RepID=UPI0031ED364E